MSASDSENGMGAATGEDVNYQDGRDAPRSHDIEREVIIHIELERELPSSGQLKSPVL